MNKGFPKSRYVIIEYKLLVWMPIIRSLTFHLLGGNEMKLSQVELDGLYAVNNQLDSMLYVVTKLEGHEATLTYWVNGRETNGGWLDVCYLRKPTKKQLENHRP